jgi:SAM-dependent methyltransferase
LNYEVYFAYHQGRQVDKWQHYFEIYDRHLMRYRNRAPRILEIGIDHGGSLQLWKEYFGEGASVVGIDIRPECYFQEPGLEIHIGDQTDRTFLGCLGEFDIVIDDGSHIPAHQQASFNYLWPKTRGVYLIEDCHDRKPALVPTPELRYDYPWVVVAEKPRRIIRGTPARELRADEQAARDAYGED